MRNKIFDFIRKTGSSPLIGYLPALYPDSETYKTLLDQSFRMGLSFIEVGIPTEDPYLDGQIIQDALKKVFQSGLDSRELLIESGKAVCTAGIHGLAMLYNETLNTYGVDRLMADCLCCGLEAVLVPNVSPGNRAALYKASLATGVEVVNFIGYSQSEEEIEEIIQMTTGFVYFQSTEGSTGGQFSAGAEAEQRLQMVKAKAASRDLPVALGFGINTISDAETAVRIGAEGVIVGTSFLRAAQNGISSFTEYLEDFQPLLEDVLCRQ